MYSIRKPLAGRLGVKTWQLPDEVRIAFEEIEAGIGCYTWAFEREEDALALLSTSRLSSFHRYPNPKNFQQAGIDLLAAIFPSHCEVVKAIEGTFIINHPYIGPRAGAGSVQSEAPHLIKRKDWLQAFGFGCSWLKLVNVDSE